MDAVILSAGQGSRLLPLTEDRPKCLLEVGGAPILARQLETLQAGGVERATVVTGFRAAAVEDVARASARRGFQVQTLYNPFYNVADNLASCWMARAALAGDVLLLNGDTLFAPAILARLLAAPAAPAAGTTVAAAASLSDWSPFAELPVDPKRLNRERVVARDKSDPAHRAFDMLRTRASRVMGEKGWRRIGVTSPTKGVGKTMVSVNLAFSLARQESSRVLLLDLDLAAPRMRDILAPDFDGDIVAALRGQRGLDTHLRRCGDNMLVALNGAPTRDSAEVLQSADTARAVGDLIEATQPTVVICDLAPVMVSDDALNFLTNVDCALIVAAAGETNANELNESMALIEEWTDILGVVLNKSEEKTRDSYGY